MDAIRELISHHPLNPELVKDTASWNRLCRGLDGVGDARTPGDKLSALNEVRGALGMEQVAAEDAEVGATVSAGLEAVKAQLEQQVNDFHERHSEPLSKMFHETVGYQYEKACAAARARFEGEYFELDRALGTEPLLRSFERFVAELNARGYRSDVSYDAEDALYILCRSQAVMDGAVDFQPRDVYLLVYQALGSLIEGACRLAADLDERTAKREPGWTPPDEDEAGEDSSGNH